MLRILPDRIVHHAHLRVRYADTDQMQIVYNGKYFEYFEVARTELLRACGLPYAQLEDDGTRLPLVEAHARYHAPARYDDVLLLESSVGEYTSPRLVIEYRIYRESTMELLVSGSTVHAFQNISTGRPSRPHPRFIEAIATVRSSTG